jgi:Flp pilus assembly protein TadD
MAWNVTFACLCLWIAFTINRPVPVTVTADPLQDRCYDENRPPAEQLEACTQLIKQWPKDSRAYLHRGLVLLDGMKLDQAIADFTRAHELDPRSPWPLANRGMSYAWKSDRERAEQDFKAVRAVDPNNPVIARGEALLDMEAGDLEGAIADLNAILARDPDDAWSLRMRSDAYQQIGDFKKAETDRERAAIAG